MYKKIELSYLLTGLLSISLYKLPCPANRTLKTIRAPVVKATNFIIFSNCLSFPPSFLFLSFESSCLNRWLLVEKYLDEEVGSKKVLWKSFLGLQIKFKPERFNKFFQAPYSCFDMTHFEIDLDHILVKTKLGIPLRIIFNHFLKTEGYFHFFYFILTILQFLLVYINMAEQSYHLYLSEICQKSLDLNLIVPWY